MRPFDLLIPSSVEEALAMLADPGGRPIAGGTDLIPLLQADKLRLERVIDLSCLPALQGIRQESDGLIRIGALTTHAQLESSALLWKRARALAQAARSVGGVQTRQRGTVGGNLINASPAADVALSLLALETQVTLRSQYGTRQLPLNQFLTGPGQTARRDDELLIEVSFVPPGPVSGSACRKLGKRSAMIIAVVSVAAVLVLEDGLIRDARIALGSVAPTVIRAPQAEALLKGQLPGKALFGEAGEMARQEARPIDDFRASAEYRRRMVSVLTRRALEEAYSQATDGPERQAKRPTSSSRDFAIPTAFSTRAQRLTTIDVGTPTRRGGGAMGTRAITMTVNGKLVTLEVAAHHTLLQVLREQLGLTGTKDGCGEGDCGTCTVLMDDAPINSCLVLAPQANGAEIVTIEGLGTPEAIHPLQVAFVEEGGTQCGYCTPGIIMSAAALLKKNPCPTEEEIRWALAGNICRCTGYTKIIAAVQCAAAELARETG